MLAHFKVSLVKSVFRICASITSIVLITMGYTTMAFYILGVGYGVAELCGILEEIVDKRE